MSIQTDWLRFEDNKAQLDHLLIASIERLSVDLVARHLMVRDREDNQLKPMTPSALRNQIAGRRAMHEDAWPVCWLLDDQFRSDAAGVLKEKISRPPDLTPEQALRDGLVRANAQGYIDARELAGLVARTKMGDGAVAAEAPVSLRGVA